MGHAAGTARPQVEAGPRILHGCNKSWGAAGIVCREMRLDAPAVPRPVPATSSPAPVGSPRPAKIDVTGMNFYYGLNRVLESITSRFIRTR